MLGHPVPFVLDCCIGLSFYRRRALKAVCLFHVPGSVPVSTKLANVVSGMIPHTLMASFLCDQFYSICAERHPCTDSFIINRREMANNLIECASHYN